MKRIVIIGAGVGGLAAAVRLARAGLDVTVLESHIYPGGCAGTFYHQGYRFDAGATLAGGFYPGGPMDRLAQAAGIERWPSHPADPAMLVHLPGGAEIARWTSEQRWAEYRAAFGRQALDFWRWQEETAQWMWNLALRQPAWPPQTPAGALNLVSTGLGWLRDAIPAGLPASLAADAFRPLAAHLKDAPEALRLFVDAQLLISAQTTSEYANALYGASALDLPNRGVVHLRGGMGSIAQRLAQAVRDSGGRVLYRHTADRIRMEKGRPVAVETQRGPVDADLVIANLPPWNLAALLGEAAPPSLRRLPHRPTEGWGAFTLYAGIDGAVVPESFPLHHQVVTGRPLGEGNSLFLSISPEWDSSRAPAGRRAVTISTHTRLGEWWDMFERDPQAYQARQESYTARLLGAAERALPGLQEAASLVLPGTPVTFQRYTRRAFGWVGGFPQTSLFKARGPRLGQGLWMVGDSIFPGQSVAAVALGGLRVAGEVLGEQAWPQRSLAPAAQLDEPPSQTRP